MTSDRPDRLIPDYFGPSSAQYVALPRSVLQSMPEAWQARFVAILDELDRTIDWRPDEGCYRVRLTDRHGQYVVDPLCDYDRGRRKIPHRQEG